MDPAFDVRVRFTVHAKTEKAARRWIEGLLVRATPPSHPLDSWGMADQDEHEQSVRDHLERVLDSLEANGEQAHQFADERRHVRAALRLLGKRTRGLSLRVLCETPWCASKGKVVNTITEIGSKAERALMVEQWSEAAEEADYCPTCGNLGVPQGGGR